MTDKEQMLVYSQKDAQIITDYINSLTFQGITAARKLAVIASILESGKPLEEYQGKGREAHGNSEPDEQGCNGAE